MGARASAIGIAACDREARPKLIPPPVVLVAKAVARDVLVTREWLGTADGSENVDIRA